MLKLYILTLKIPSIHTTKFNDWIFWIKKVFNVNFFLSFTRWSSGQKINKSISNFIDQFFKRQLKRKTTVPIIYSSISQFILQSYLLKNNESTKFSNQLNIKEICDSKENKSIASILIHIKASCTETNNRT